ncbi:MAG: immune inhibitor A, partial [Candidatus Poribacteria bacterium]|nr:immune inhibitor A [Candidatus Poribacteria bacterium]
STSLTDWAQDITVSAANYGAAHLFFEFLSTHYGGYEMLGVVAQNEEDGLASIDSSLTQLGFDVTADDVFADWLIANYLSAEQGAYSYKKLTDTPIKNLYKQAPDSISHNIQAFGADYYVTSTESDRINIVFTGEPETSLIGVPAHSGKTCWWTNHGDSIDSKLTRVIDLTSVDSATLRYWTFYDIEEFWDYAYVMVSPDEGATWDILSTNSTTDLDPNGNAYGSGLTGATAGWVQDFVDLSDYAGKELLLRFEYITDDAVSSKGACFDDFEIPEINWSDDSSNIGGWISDGFVLAKKSVPTQYLIQVIHEKNIGEPVVYQIPVDSTAVGSLTVKGVGKDDFIVMIISAVNRHSTIPTDYTLSIST